MRYVAKRIAGFTLVEMILAMSIISIAALAITSSLGLALRHQSDGIWRAKTMALADTYLEQILARRFDENTPLGGTPPCDSATCSTAANFDDGEMRALYDDVDDFNGLDDLPPVDETGAVLTAFPGYRVQVAVAYPTAAQVTALGIDNAVGVKIITVSVTPPGEATQQFRALKGNF